MSLVILLSLGCGFFFVAWVVTFLAALQWRSNAFKAEELLAEATQQFKRCVEDFEASLRY